VPLGASVEDLGRLTRAWANVVLYREIGESATRFLQERFGIPRITTPMIGSAGTGAVLRAVGEACSLGAERVRRVVFGELARTAKLPWYARLQTPQRLRGCRVAIFGDFTYAVGLGYALSREVGLEISWSGTYLGHLEHDFAFHAGTFTERTFVADDPDEVALRVERTRPDLLIGTHLEREAAERVGVTFLPLCPPAAVYPFVGLPLMGYRGAATLADTLDGAMRRMRTPEASLTPRDPVLEVTWSREALAGLEEIPPFLRGRARRLAEERARQLGEPRVTRKILDETRF
jgi:light-independent protochlorophyllide reductase subunit B